MKINTKALLDTSGFSCISMAFDSEAGIYIELEARAVFITEGAVERARTAQRSMAPIDPSRLPELRYGDVLISRQKPCGTKEGLHIPAGRDAALVVGIVGSDGFERNIPFSGIHMLSARQKLLSMESRGRTLSESQRLILEGIQGTLEIIAAQPDPKRFSEELIGQAFMCSLVDRSMRIDMSITDVEFSRKARADMIRAQISRRSPNHPDGIAGACGLDEILQDVGVQARGQAGADIQDFGGIQITEEAMRGMISSNGQLCHEVFEVLTATPVSKLGAAAISTGEFDLLADELFDQILSGSWVERVKKRAGEITGAQVPGYQFEMMMIAVDGVDIMAIRDSVGAASGQAFVYSWPTADRIPLASVAGEAILNISPEEIPDENEIRRLSGILDAMVIEDALEGEPGQGRIARMA